MVDMSLTPIEREVKRARNRRGGEGEHVHQPEELLELLLVHHAEALLLVDHDQAEILENDILGNQAVRADDDIHAAVVQLPQHLALLGRRAEAAQHFDPHRVVEHALAGKFR